MRRTSRPSEGTVYLLFPVSLSKPELPVAASQLALGSASVPRSPLGPPSDLAFQPWVMTYFIHSDNLINQPKWKRRNFLPSLFFLYDPLWASLIFSLRLLASRSSSVCSVRPLRKAVITCSHSQRHSNKGGFPDGVFQRQLARLSPRAAQRELLRAALGGRGPAPHWREPAPLHRFCIRTSPLASCAGGL